MRSNISVRKINIRYETKTYNVNIIGIKIIKYIRGKYIMRTYKI